MNELLKNRLQNLTKALQLEKQFELDEYAVGLKSKSIQDRVGTGKTIYPLHYVGIKYTRFGDELLEFELNDSIDTGRFSNGTLIEMFNQDNETEKGIVYYVSSDKISVKINFHDVEDWVKKGKIGINLLPDSKTYDLYLDKLKSIKDTVFSTSIISLYENKPKKIELNATNTLRLNNSQSIATNTILNEQNPVTIIHGPPGTGKTTTLVSAINDSVKLKKKVIVCAPTNSAVDYICQKLIETGIDICRLGNPMKIESSIENYTLDGLAKNDSSFKLVEQLKKQAVNIRKQAFKFKRKFGKEEFIERKQLKQELKSIRKDIKGIQKDIYQNILEKSSVICGTFVGVLSENITKLEFDYLIIDEAGQAIEPAIWSVSHLANSLVLAGDNFQLPPFVHSNEAVKLGLGKSVLDMVHEIGYPTCLLNIQYRMNEKIMSFSNSYFYSKQLQSASTVINWQLDSENFEAIEFMDTAGCGFDEEIHEATNGLSNRGEINIIEKRIKALDLESISYGIISPYRLQVSLLQSTLPVFKNHINTIDSFQGQERDCIILSLVRSNNSNSIGFLNDYRRMNVAITRAKKKLIIIGDSATIGNDKFYGNLLDYIENNGSYRSAWEYM